MVGLPKEGVYLSPTQWTLALLFGLVNRSADMYTALHIWWAHQAGWCTDVLLMGYGSMEWQWHSPTNDGLLWPADWSYPPWAGTDAAFDIGTEDPGLSRKKVVGSGKICCHRWGRNHSKSNPSSMGYCSEWQLVQRWIWHCSIDTGRRNLHTPLFAVNVVPGTTEDQSS